MQKSMYEDLANPVGDLKEKKGIAYALGASYTHPMTSEDGRKELKKKFDAAMGNYPYRQQVEEEFEKGKE